MYQGNMLHRGDGVAAWRKKKGKRDNQSNMEKDSEKRRAVWKSGAGGPEQSGGGKGEAGLVGEQESTQG